MSLSVNGFLRAPAWAGVVRTGFCLAAGCVAAGRGAEKEQAADGWLSDQPWRSGLVYSVYDPHYGRSSPEVRRNQAFSGTALTLRGKVHARGLGAARFSVVELDVPPGVTALAAVLGIDDRSPEGGGETYFSLWSEGERVWRSPGLGREDAPLAVVLPVSGRSRIALVTDAQAYGNPDLADWCGARWLQTPVDRPEARWLPAPGTWSLRPEWHPFHLLYRGEDLTVTAVHDEPAEAAVRYVVAAADGTQVLTGEVPLVLAAAAGREAAAVGRVRLPFGGLPNGLYRLDLTLLSGGREAARRGVAFGVLTSRAGRPLNGSIYGANHHEFVASCEVLAAAGIEWSRLWFCREWIEPRRGDWHWHWHDERLAAAREFGIRTIGVLGGIGQPAWTSPANVPENWGTTHGFPEDLAAWEEYVRQIATRYRGQIQVWESWNEIMGAAENGRNGWTIPRYVDLHRRTWKVLKAVDPGNRVLVSADRLSFVDRCLGAGLGDAFDGVVIHPYRPSNAPEAGCANATTGVVGDVWSVFTESRAWLDGHGRRDAGVWATEIGWAVTGNEWPVIPLETHGQYLARTFLLAQASGHADNLCWHDVAHGMFGFCDNRGFPRPALLGFAGLTERLSGARAVSRLPADGALHGVLFRRSGTDVLALWSESGTEFALLTPPAPLQLARFDAFGNETRLSLDAAGSALPVTGWVQYLEGTGLDTLRVARTQPVTVEPETVEVIAGRTARFRCTVRNVFADAARFHISAAATEGLVFPAPAAVDLARGEAQTVEINLGARPDTPPATHAVALTVTTPAGIPAPLTFHARVMTPVRVSIEPFETERLGREPVPVKVLLHNRDEQPAGGEVALALPDGMAAEPAALRFDGLAPGGTAALTVTLSATRPPRLGDALVATAVLENGARASLTRSLTPVVTDRDGDGLADGWRLNPPGGGESPRGNAAEAAIEEGDTEFHCQRVRCGRFVSGWVILHRDNQDPIVKGRRYRITFRARQQGLSGTIGVAVYNIQPWESCGIERHVRAGTDWQDFSLDFTAVRDSTNTRFEFYFTETGTLWLEGMRLQEAARAP